MRQVAIALLAAALAVGTAGCGSDAEGDDAEAQKTVTKKIPLPDSREQVRATAEDVINLLVSESGPLTGRDPRVRFASGTWKICTDDATGWSYDTNGRIDLAGADGGLDLLAPISRQLEEQGWKVDSAPKGADPRTTVTARKGPHLVRVRAYEDQAFLITEVLGPCLPATDSEKAELEAQNRSEPLDL